MVHYVCMFCLHLTSNMQFQTLSHYSLYPLSCSSQTNPPTYFHIILNSGNESDGAEKEGEGKQYSYTSYGSGIP